jgi:hypothetical protein
MPPELLDSFAQFVERAGAFRFSHTGFVSECAKSRSPREGNGSCGDSVCPNAQYSGSESPLPPR